MKRSPYKSLLPNKRGLRSRRRSLGFEALEARRVLATVSWAVDADGFWDVGGNWSTGAPPQSGDEVILERESGVYAITYRAATSQVSSITGSERLLSTGGVLEVSGTLQLDNDLRLSGGALKNATVAPSSGGQIFEIIGAGATLDGVTLGRNTTLREGSSGSGNQVTVLNGLTLTNNSLLRLERPTFTAIDLDTRDVGLNFAGVQTLGGNGTVELLGNVSSAEEDDVRIRPTGGGTLTIGSGITIRNATNSLFVTLGDVSGGAIINQGTIVSQSSGQTLRVTGSTVTNDGALSSIAGELDTNNLTINPGSSVSVGPGSLRLRGNWDNNSSITQSGGTIHLGDTFTLADLGINEGRFTGSSGTVSIFGTLDGPQHQGLRAYELLRPLGRGGMGTVGSCPEHDSADESAIAWLANFAPDVLNARRLPRRFGATREPLAQSRPFPQEFKQNA